MSAEKQVFTRYPVISLGAEYLVMGHLMRRNILTYKAPPNNEGYDLICIHPDPRAASKQVRVQVTFRVCAGYLYFIFITRIASPSRSVTPLVRRIAQSFLMTP